MIQFEKVFSYCFALKKYSLSDSLIPTTDAKLEKGFSYWHKRKVSLYKRGTLWLPKGTKERIPGTGDMFEKEFSC